MTPELLKKTTQIFSDHPKVKLAYLFGSQAKGTTGPLSDYDFAVYLDERDKKKCFDIKLDLLNQLSQALNSDDVQVVILDTTEMPELKYSVIAEGKRLFTQEPYAVIVEPRILQEYFDFKIQLQKYGLTKAK